MSEAYDEDSGKDYAEEQSALLASILGENTWSCPWCKRKYSEENVVEIMKHIWSCPAASDGNDESMSETMLPVFNDFIRENPLEFARLCEKHDIPTAMIKEAISGAGISCVITNEPDRTKG